MTYRELLDRYKRDELDENEKNQVRYEIEKHDAISEYLADALEEELYRETLPENNDVEIPGKGERSQRIADAEKEFGKYVKKAIRRSFCKAGLGIGAGVLAILLFIQFALSPIVSSIYYDPSKQIEVLSEDGNSAMIFTQMGIDLGVYTELVLPGKMEPQVSAFPQGYGKYSVMISPLIYYGITRQQSVGGQIDKGRLQLYDPGFLKEISVNTFVCYGMDPDSDLNYEEQLALANAEDESKSTSSDQWTASSQWFYGSLEEGEKAIERLDDDKTYVAYVSLKEKLNFQQMYEMLDRILLDTPDYIASIWLGVNTSDNLNFFEGFKGYYYDRSGLSLPYNYNEDYPELSYENGQYQKTGHWESIQKKMQDEKTVMQHFISLLRYMSDQEQFLSMISSIYGTAGNYKTMPENFGRAAGYVEENGLSYYGFACITTKADMLHMLEEEEIAGIVPIEY